MLKKDTYTIDELRLILNQSIGWKKPKLKKRKTTHINIIKLILLHH